MQHDRALVHSSEAQIGRSGDSFGPDQSSIEFAFFQHFTWVQCTIFIDNYSINYINWNQNFLMTFLFCMQTDLHANDELQWPKHTLQTFGLLVQVSGEWARNALFTHLSAHRIWECEPNFRPSQAKQASSCKFFLFLIFFIVCFKSCGCACLI